MKRLFSFLRIRSIPLPDSVKHGEALYMKVCASSGFGDFADYQGFGDDRVPIPHNLRAFQNGLEAVKLDKQRRRAIHAGMRFVDGWRFRRLSAVWGRPR